MWYPTIKIKTFTFSDGSSIEYDIDGPVLHCGDMMMVGFSFK